MANERHVLQVYVGALSRDYEALSIEANKQTTAEEIVECISEKLNLKDPKLYELAEVSGIEGTEHFKERRLNAKDYPVSLQLLWPEPKQQKSFLKNLTSSNNSEQPSANRFCLRKKQMQCMNWSFSWTDSNDSQLLKDYFLRFLYQPKDKENPDLCKLPDLTEQTLLENLKARFEKGHIYTYVGSILIAVNPFKFFPIYNPKYVQLYQNRRLGELPPHIFAIADAAYQEMLRKRYNQCIVISGESGSGKTESTNLLLHHLTALSQKGAHGCGVDSRFGKFIQVNYKENGMVHSAIIQKYLLEKSRIVSQAKNERNYHVFYYLLAGATQAEKESLYLTKASDYSYLNQSKCYTLEGVDEAYEYSRLKQSLEMVGFTSERHKRVNSVISAVLHLGNVEFTKKSTYHCDEAVMVKNQDEVAIISKLLMVKEETLMSALTCKRTKAAKGETIIINYKTADAIATRDAMAKCLYGALFEWIVMQVNQALLIKKDFRDHKGNYIGLLDLFGFEDFGDNYFEQFNINFVNEKLHHYFNQHVFKYEQEEYQREDITWTSIDFHDNIACIQLIEGRPQGLLCLLDDQCNFPGANNQNVLQKFVNYHKDNPLFEIPPCRQNAFVIKHYAGKVKYQIKDFREKNLDLMRSDIVCLLKSSSSAFVRELVGQDPLSIFRWQILKAFFKAYFIFTKLREESKARRAAQEAAAANQVKPAKKFDFGSKKINENDSKTAVKKSNRPSIASNSAFQRFHNSILNANNVNNVNNTVPSSKKTQPRKLNLINNGTIQFSRDENCPDDASVLHKAHKILQKSKLNRPPSFKSKGIEKSIKNLQTLKAIVGKNTVMPSRTGRKQTPTVTFQFQQSLNHLMELLNQANPFFIRCIKSNTEKKPNNFNDMLVLVQLRYTGMLETVRIRQSGYSVRLSFEEFIQHYRILLPKGLLSSRNDIKEFLERMNLNQANYQMGKTKVFMRESEKLALDDILHQEILRRIITLQRWVRTWITSRKFNQVKQAVLIIQKHVRRWLAQQRLLQLKWTNMYEQWAATTIQKTWKSFKDRNAFIKFRNATVNFQAHVRGLLSRERFRERLASFHKSRSSSAFSATVFTTTAYSSTINTPMITTTIKHVSIVNSASRRPSEEVSSRETVDEPADTSRFTNFSPPKSHLPSSKDIRKGSEDSSLELIDDYEFNQMMSRKKSNVSVSSLSGSVQPPPLPPRKQSQVSIGTNASEISNLQEDELFEEDEEGDFDRLDRRRNKPVRKPSIKRSKSSKIQSYSMQEESTSVSSFDVVKSPSETDLVKTKFGDQTDQTQPVNAQQPQKNAFQKGKKLFKTLIIGGSSKTERKSKENLIDSDQTSDLAVESSRLKKQNSETSASILGAVNQNTVPNAFNHAIGHNLKSYVNCSKGDNCSVCENNIAQGNASYVMCNAFKYSDCDLLFHNNCSSSAVQIPCVSKKSVEFYTNSAYSTSSFVSSNAPIAGTSQGTGYTKNTQQTTSSYNPSRPPRNKYRNKPNKPTAGTQTNSGGVCKSSSYSSSSVGSKQSGSTSNKFNYNGSSSWNVTRTAEFCDPFDILIADVTELHYMDIFIGNKLCEMDPAKKKKSKESMVDVVFKNALKEFKSNLISTYSVVSSQDGSLYITNKSLIEHFEQVVTNVCQKENTWKSFPVIMGVNAFRGYLDEFRSLAKFNAEDKPKYEKPSKGVKRKRGEKKVVREDVIEKHGHKFNAVTANIPTVCEICQSLMWLTEKIWVCKECKLTCHKKCVNKITADCRSNMYKMNNRRVFGAPLDSLVNDENQIPVVLEKLITAIEMKGLYTEGIYRKSGTTSKINELKQLLENNDTNVDLDQYSVHVLTAASKAFLREMPEPLMTYELYQSFILATAISDNLEKVQTLFGHINKLPRTNYDVLERLIFHLARVAQQENANRMNANSLAIVFAPCVLRTDKPMQMQDKLSDISKQTVVLECIINERLKQVKATLDDIFILDEACHNASSRLSSLRHSKLNLNRDNTVNIRNPNEVEDEEAILAQQIKHLRTEKELLTNMLPSFRLTGSDEDLLSNADIENSMMAQDFDDFLLSSPAKRSTTNSA